MGPVTVGTSVPVRWEARDESGALTNPAVVYFAFRRQADITATIWQFGVSGTIANPSTGIFDATPPWDVPGFWRVGFRSDGSLKLISEEDVEVITSSLFS